MHKDARKIKARIKSAFNNLAKENIIALSNFTCCNNCAGAEIDQLLQKHPFEGFAFYHAQDNECINEHGSTMISHGDTTEIAHKIVKALQNAKLIVKWNGNMDTRIEVVGIAK